ncbi:MAG TPA: protein kinase, partial [Actinomycetota bacterium]|nr:protein kinase [Actinomycetota bacterium]
ADPSFRERFLREASAAASIEHPNIVPVYSAGESEGTLFLAMRFVDGTDLRRRLADGPLEPAAAAAIVSQVADALDAAHERGLVHRDVKPGNVLLDRGHRAYLADFGLVRRATGTTLTQSGQFLGTVDYCAPEQIRGQEPGPAADVYSLGCVLYECLTGSPPFRRDTEVATLYAHLEDPVPRPSASHPRVPTELDEVVARAMAKRPEDRYPTAGALALACTNALGAPAPPRPRPRRRTALVASLVAAIAVTVALVALIRGAGGPTPTGGHDEPVVPPTNSVVQMDPDSGEVIDVIETGYALAAPEDMRSVDVNLAVGEGGVWISGELPVLHVDPLSGTVRPPIEGTRYTREIAVGFRTVWLAAWHGFGLGAGGIEAVDPATDRIVGHTDVPKRASGTSPSFQGVAASETSVWASTDYGSLVRIDPATSEIREEIRIGAIAGDVAAGVDAIWVADELDGVIVRVDPSTGETDRIPQQGNAKDIVVGEGWVWVLDPAARTVTPIDPDTHTAERAIGVGPDPVDLAVGAGAVWVADQTGMVTRIDAVTSDVTQLEVGSPIAAVEVDPTDGMLWLLIADRDP